MQPFPEAPLFRVEFEHLKAVTRERVKVAGGVEDILASVRGARPNDSADFGLAEVEAQLLSLKRKLDERVREEEDALRLCRARAAHAEEATAPDPKAQRLWRQKQLDRLVCDHLLRSGHTEAAAQLAGAAGCQDLVDRRVLGALKKVEAALLEGDCGPALAWCEEHRSRLRKAHSSLEFRLRLQQFVQLARAGQQLQAVAHARKHLAPFGAASGQHLAELQPVMATLLFPSPERLAEASRARYEGIVGEGRWERLVRELRSDCLQVHGLTQQPLLALYAQAGLAALNTAHVAAEECADNPLSDAAARRLAAGLPHAKHIHSWWVCPITKALMDENNPPMVLPNGYVYSRKAMEEQARRSGGKVMCLRTGQGPFELSKLQKVFLA